MVSLKGETSKMFRPIKEQIAEILSLIEVNIDDAEYEVSSSVQEYSSKIAADVSEYIGE